MYDMNDMARILQEQVEYTAADMTMPPLDGTSLIQLPPLPRDTDGHPAAEQRSHRML